jgi:hypothetical protein
MCSVDAEQEAAQRAERRPEMMDPITFVQVSWLNTLLTSLPGERRLAIVLRYRA